MSVREMAIASGVNPNTVQRTYGELERMGIVETKRGQGTFVREDEEKIAQLKNQLQTKIIGNFISNMKELGVSETEVKDGLHEYLRQSRGEES